jgi:hypothetical protein
LEKSRRFTNARPIKSQIARRSSNLKVNISRQLPVRAIRTQRTAESSLPVCLSERIARQHHNPLIRFLPYCSVTPICPNWYSIAFHSQLSCCTMHCFISEKR